MGCSISSNNHTRKRKLQGDQTLSQLRKPQEVMQSLERKLERKKEMCMRVIDITKVNLNDMVQVKLCMSIGTKSGLSKKRHNLTDCNRLHL